ncbi:L-threonylcarbamoyladenylate synthase [Gammaproteobacteria bacterium]|nr:L-threonylcarbamoyladenylate synthase [Gammaproteobacteria bacterium]
MSPFDTAVRAVCQGGVIAYPTESCFGLGCNPRSISGLRQIIALKRRRPEKGMIVLIGDVQDLSQLCPPLDTSTLQMLSQSWPGAVSFILPARADLPSLLHGGTRCIAVRLSAFEPARRLARAAGGTLVSTSANLSSRPALRYAGEVRRLFGSRLDGLVVGRCGDATRPSRLIDATSGRVLRS